MPTRLEVDARNWLFLSGREGKEKSQLLRLSMSGKDGMVLLWGVEQGKKQKGSPVLVPLRVCLASEC